MTDDETECRDVDLCIFPGASVSREKQTALFKVWIGVGEYLIFCKNTSWRYIIFRSSDESNNFQEFKGRRFNICHDRYELVRFT